MKIVIACQKFGNEGLANYLFQIASELRNKGIEIVITTTFCSEWREIIFKSPLKTKLKERKNKIPIYNLSFSFLVRIKILLLIPYLAILKNINIEKYKYFTQNLLSRGFKESIKNILKDTDYVYGVAAIRPHFLLAFQKYSQKPFHLFPLIHTMEPWSELPETIALFKDSDKIFVSTSHEKNWLKAHNIKSEIIVIGMGLFLDKNIVPKPDDFIKKHNLKRNIILFIGRMRSEKYDKGYIELAKSASFVFKEYPDTCFVFIGRKDNYANVFFKNIKSNRIIDIGWATEQEKINALSACDIFVMPSSSESFGEVFLEAWNYRKPVIGADIEVSKEIIENNKSGLVVNKEPKDLARKIITLLENPKMCELIGENGYKSLHNKYNWDKVMDKVFNNIQ